MGVAAVKVHEVDTSLAGLLGVQAEDDDEHVVGQRSPGSKLDYQDKMKMML